MTGASPRGLAGARSRRIVRGSGALMASTVVTFACGLALAGIMARGFSAAEFGLWGILVSLGGMFMSGFDWGFGNALRNRLAQLGARGGHGEARECFLAVFSWFAASAAVLVAVFWLARPFVPWGALLGTGDQALARTGSLLFASGCSAFALSIAFNLFTPGFFGYGESHWNACFSSLARLSALAVTAGLAVAGASFFLVSLSSFLVVLGWSVAGFFSFLAIRGWAFGAVGFGKTLGAVAGLWRKSALFSVLQVFSVLLLNGDLVVVSHASGLGAAGDYFIVKRLFLALSAVHFALLLPVWSEYTRAFEHGDYAWARAALARTARITCGLLCAGFACLAFLGRPVARAWIGREVGDPWLFVWLGIWCVLYGWGNCFSVFLNAVGRLRRQAALVAAVTAAFFPLGQAMGRHWGVAGICWALILTSVPAAVSNPMESLRVLRVRAAGAREEPHG